LAALGPEPLVVIGHSRGACDTLYFALEDPGFVHDRVRALFLVQGPFGGTDIADYVVGDGPAMDRRIPLRYRAIANLLGRAERFRMNQGKHGGLAGLARYASRRFWDRMLAENPAAVPLVGPKTYYITSEAPLSQLRLFKRATGWYLQTFAGPNDGVVALEDQSLPGLGTVVAVLEAGHSDLTNRGPATRAPRQFRRALIQAVLMKVGHPEGKSSSTRAESAELPTPIRRATFQAP
jgi:pimeloyl-ACP methyl ester carboxylesterase